MRQTVTLSLTGKERLSTHKSIRDEGRHPWFALGIVGEDGHSHDIAIYATADQWKEIFKIVQREIDADSTTD